MKNLIISFKSRNSLYMFAKTMRANGITTSIINTPRSIAISCGLSIKTEMRYFSILLILLKQSKISDFIGMFSELKNETSIHYERLF